MLGVGVPGPTPGDVAAETDPADVGSVLTEVGGWVTVDALALDFGWTWERTATALDELDCRLRSVGQRVAWGTDSQVVIVPACPPVAIQPASWRSLETNGIDEVETRMLYCAMEGLGRGNSRTRDGARRLVKAGLLEFADTEPGGPVANPGNLRLTALARYNLYLTDAVPTENPTDQLRHPKLAPEPPLDLIGQGGQLKGVQTLGQ